ncbi:MAG: TRAP transporter substrate-binding protein [Desulfobacterales bacterium]|nr:TRAP transporter substrate-binding protein [Desulfobacterales bacterium]
MKKSLIAFVSLSFFLGLTFLSIPGLADAQKPITWRMQTTWPAGMALHDSAVELANRISELSGGRLKIEITPAGTMVPAFEVLDAVHRGTIDAGHGWSAYWIGKHPAANLFSSVAGGPFGMDNVDYSAWLYYGGGWEYYNRLYADILKMQVVVFPTDIIPSEPLGWFKKPITAVEDLKGLKFRASGLTAEIYRELGMSIITLPGGEIVSALERGIIDGAEFMCPTSDKDLGFQDVVKYYHAPGMHRHTGTLELIVNKKSYEKLPADLQKIIDIVARENLLRAWVRLVTQNAKDLEELQTRYKVQMVETPPEVISAILKAWDRVAARYVEKDPFFAEVYQSQKDFAATIVPFRRSFYVPYELGSDYYWPR